MAVLESALDSTVILIDSLITESGNFSHEAVVRNILNSGWMSDCFRFSILRSSSPNHTGNRWMLCSKSQVPSSEYLLNNTSAWRSCPCPIASCFNSLPVLPDNLYKPVKGSHPGVVMNTIGTDFVVLF